MRYCHKTTTGEPLFCHFCGASFDAKLCPARHINPRWAEVCSQCGSRDLSTPAPKVPLWLAPLLFVLSLVPGILLILLLIVVAVAIFNALLTNQQIQAQLVVLLLLLALLWLLYLRLPRFVKDLFRSLWRRPKKDRRPH